LEDVSNEVDEFLALYPTDRRAEEIKQYKERIELDKLERKFERHEGGNADPSLLPAERLYLQAIDTTKTTPETAIAMLQSLVDLYSPAMANDQGRIAAIVQLAKRRVDALKRDLAKQHEQQLQSLRERLRAAGDVAAKDLVTAAAMYRAIISLHEKDAWAAEVVDESRKRLAEVEATTP
jgi:methyl coenzyme M reductase beta subunit